MYKYVHKLCIYIFIEVYIFEIIIIYIYNAYSYLFGKKIKIIKSWISNSYLIIVIIAY